ncbi:uncharacterized protein LOC114308579 [Camellia sinensis]|uniref:uncharacterized protein LOC114308579 n=1 Tax=Camellia sinensis TaxID=4442 RepID=UPI0010360E97|nr:uncharacterized protein LOC114308579 [Camellia sinensis]
MATVTDATDATDDVVAANVGGDQNPRAIEGPLNHHERPEKFAGVNFKRWQQKMLFYPTTLSLASFLSEDPSVMEENEQDKQKLMALNAWKQSDFLCQNYALNGLADSLFNVFYAKKSAKELWDALDKKYKIEDAGERNLSLASLWTSKLWTQKPSLVKSTSSKQQEEIGNTSTVKANVVKHGQSSRVKKKLPTGKSSKLEARGGVSKRPVYKPQEPTFRFNGKCFNCGSNGHQAIDCRKKKKPYKKYPPRNKSCVHMVEMKDLSQDVDDMHMSTVVSEVNMVGSNPKEWWVDTGATHRICAEKKTFTTFELVSNGEKLFMGNSTT